MGQIGHFRQIGTKAAKRTFGAKRTKRTKVDKSHISDIWKSQVLQSTNVRFEAFVGFCHSFERRLDLFGLCSLSDKLFWLDLWAHLKRTLNGLRIVALVPFHRLF